MAGTTRVPRNDPEFDNYIKNTTRTLNDPGPPPGAARLQITALELAQWTGFEADWVLTYAKYTNDSLRTAGITDHKNNIKRDFIAFAKKPLVRMSSLDLSENDRLVFHLPEADTTPTKRGKIHETPYGEVSAAGVAAMKVRVRMTHDAKRSSIHPLADGVELRYAVIDMKPTAVPATDGGNSTPTLGPTPALPVATQPVLPENAMDAPNSMVSKKALFDLVLDASASGKRLFVFMRWVNQSTPANNSTWSNVMQSNIL